MMAAPRFYSCSCFTTDNIFLEQYQLHVRYENAQQFAQDYRAMLVRLGCDTEQQFNDVLEKVLQEVTRRKLLDEAAAERTAIIQKTYRPLHPQVYQLQDSHVDPGLRRMAEYCRGDGASLEGLLQMLEEEPAPRVYRLPVFQSSFCQQLLEELQHFEKSPAPKGRPNTMNHHGILVDELGLDRGLITPLRERFLQPVAALLFPDCGGRHLDSHRAFVVKYALGEDRGLGFHYDNAEVTLNLCLGEEFSQGELYFGDMREVALADSVCREVAHRRGGGLLHRGEQMHGALPLAAGRRWNLVVWMRASRHRNQRCPMCRRPPARVGGRGYADGFTMGGAGPGGAGPGGEEPGGEEPGPGGEEPEGEEPEGEGPGAEGEEPGGEEPGGAGPGGAGPGGEEPEGEEPEGEGPGAEGEEPGGAGPEGEESGGEGPGGAGLS